MERRLRWRMKPATDSWRVDETYIRPRRIKAQGGPDARVQALLERPAGSGRDIAGSKIIKGQFGLPKSFGTDPYMYGITCLPQGMYLSATDPFWPAAHEIRVNYSIWLGAIFLFVTGAGLFRWTHRSRSASIKQGKNDAVRHKIDESHDAMHLLIAFLNGSGLSFRTSPGRRFLGTVSFALPRSGDLQLLSR